MPDIVEQTALLDALTDKQREVIALVSEGMTSKEIARKLGISESAVNQRIEMIRQRLGGMSRARIGRLYRDTSTLVITIPTSNSLTGKSIQLQAREGVEQHSIPEGVDDLTATAADDVDVLQPSTHSRSRVGSQGLLYRMGLIVWIAVGLIALVVLCLAAVHMVRHDISG